MIYNVSLEERRNDVLEYLKDRQYKRVVDIGGSMFPWAREYVTHYFDVTDIHEYLKGSDLYDENVRKSIMLQGDINDGYGWEKIWEDVTYRGKFDFAICTQTLEDIRNPTYVLRTLPKIAKEGFISIPHKYRELNYVEGHGDKEQKEWELSKSYMGYFHHRWIFSMIDGTSIQSKRLRLFPKLEFITCLSKIKDLTEGKFIGNELSFYWEGDNIPYEIVNNDFLGPNPPTVFRLYEKLIEEGV